MKATAAAVVAVAALMLAAPAPSRAQTQPTQPTPLAMCEQMLRCQCHEAPSVSGFGTGACVPMNAYAPTLLSAADVGLVNDFNSVARQAVMAMRKCIFLVTVPTSFKGDSYVNRAQMCVSLSRDRLNYTEYLIVSDVLAEGFAALGRSSLDFGATPSPSSVRSNDVAASGANARLLSQLARDAVPDSQQAIPVFTGAFWQDKGGFTTLGDELAQYDTTFTELLRLRDERNFSSEIFVKSFLKTSLNALGPAETSLTKNSLSAEELLGVARDGNVRMKAAQEPLPAMLEQVNTDCKAKIEAVKTFETKELQVKRANAIFNLIKATVKLAASVLTAGASSAAKFTDFYAKVKDAVKAGSKVQLKKLPGMFRRQVSKAAQLALAQGRNVTASTYAEVKAELRLDLNDTLAGNGTRLARRVEETKELVANGREMLGELQDALKEVSADDPMHSAAALLRVAGGPLDDVAGIADALSVFANGQKEQARIDAQAQGSLANLDRGISLAQAQLGRLMEQAAAISLTILKTVEWQNDDAVTLADTAIPSSLFEAPEVWTATVEQIISILEENEACPDPAAPNPFAAQRLLLAAELLQVRDGALAASSGDARLLQLYERAATASPFITTTEFRRTLGLKPTSEAERQAAHDAFEKLRGSCGVLAQQLKEFARWAQSSHKALFDAVRGIRDVLLGRIQLGAANANVQLWELALQKMASNSDASFAAEFLLAGHGEALEQRTASAIEALCRAFRYAQPLVNQADVTAAGTGSTGSLDMAACKVKISGVGSAPAPSMLERIRTLRKLISAVDEPLRKSGLVNLRQSAGGLTIGQRVEYAASCALKTTSFVEELLDSPGRQAQFDVRFTSFASDGNPSTACQDNAEFESMLVVFRDAGGNIVPDPVRNPDRRIDVAVEPVKQRSMFKYLQVGRTDKRSQWRELAYELQGHYAFGISYRTIKEGGDCDKSQNKEVLGSDGRSVTFCVQRTIAVDSLPFSRLPVFGTWQLSLVRPWPSDVPRPASVEIKLNHFASGLATCAADASRASIIPTTAERGRRGSVSARAEMIGLNICGGRPQVRVGGQQAVTGPGAGEIAGLVIGALLIVGLVPATVLYLRRRDVNRAEWAGHATVGAYSGGGVAGPPSSTFKTPPMSPPMSPPGNL